MKLFYYIFTLILFIIIAVHLVSGAHYVTGRVNDSKDFISANNHEIVLWNPLNGIEDNLTDIIGPLGNSGTDNYFLIDCELLNIPCYIGDLLNIKVIEKNYRNSYTTTLIVTGAGFDVARELFLNIPPKYITLNYPRNNANITNSTINFNCSATDFDYNLNNITLYGNWTSGWHANETKSINTNFSSAIFTKNLPDGTYKYNCISYDNLSLANWSNINNTFTLDSTPPNITNITLNESKGCGNIYIRIDCTVTDNLAGIGNVTIQAIKPSGIENFSAKLFGGNVYYADIQTDEVGDWRFNCIANDSFGNIANLTSEMFSVYDSAVSEINLSFNDIVFDNENPIEFQLITINATIHNSGCGNANNFLVGFFKGSPILGNQIGENKTISIPGFSTQEVNITWNAEIGLSNIFVFADINNSLTEINETDNIANKTIWITAWQKIFGNVSSHKVISNYYNSNLSIWLNQTSISGNIFITDSESQINWMSLQAIGKNKTGNITVDDFSEIDNILNMAGLNDSIYSLYTNSGIISKNDSFIVQKTRIENVPVINSTNNSYFITGLLWDTSKDYADGEFSIDDKEPLVFITKINMKHQGYYGNYDYEIAIPAKLREYDNTEVSKVYLYYDLI